MALASRFHLADWHRSIDEKLKTIDDLYQSSDVDAGDHDCAPVRH